MPTYTCEKCGRIFKQKSGYTDHQNKKTDCIANSAIGTLVEKKVKEALVALTPYSELVLPTEEIARKAVLQAYFENIHNLLWARSGLSPEKSIEHLTFFFAYRLIEDHVETLGLPKECRWSSLAALKNGNDVFEMLKNGWRAFQRNAVTAPFFKKPEIDKAELLYDIVQQMNRFRLADLRESDTLSDLYEYLLGRGMSTMADTGQYYTGRDICALAFRLAHGIKKSVRRADGTLCTFADWFCGTGGFPAAYIKGLKALGEKVDWETESSSISCQDMSISSITATMLNLLILTGTPFSETSVRSGNSFTDPITIGPSAPFAGVGVDYLFTNPPYGGDKTAGKEFKFKYSAKAAEGGKRYFVNAEIRSIGVEDDDKVSAGVQLSMATLADGGVCCIVLPQGFFFGASKKAVELRRRLAEEYNIRYVVDIAAGAFLNTGTKTSLLVFQKGVGATETVQFLDMSEKVLAAATLAEVAAKRYSLNYKQYLPQELVEREGFTMVKLGDIIEKTKSGKTNSTSITNSGEYPFYGCTAKVPTGTHNSYDFEGDDYLLFAKSGGNAKTRTGENLGIGKFHHIKGKTAGNIAVYQYKIKDTTKVLYRYLYYILKTKLFEIQKLADYTTGNGNINIETMYNTIQIPLPSLERQQEIVEAIDVWADFAHREEEMVRMYEKQMQFLVKEMGRGKPRVKLGDIIEIENGKYITKATTERGEYSVYGGGDASYTINTFNRENKFIVNKDGMSQRCVRFVSGKFWLNHHGWTFSAKNKSPITEQYVGYWLLRNQDMIYSLGNGTAQKGMNKSLFLDVEVPLPSLAEQQSLQPDFDEIRHKYAKIADYTARASEAIQRLIPGAI